VRMREACGTRPMVWMAVEAASAPAKVVMVTAEWGVGSAEYSCCSGRLYGSHSARNARRSAASITSSGCHGTAPKGRE
jgi:hypothetical protein